MLKQMAGCGWIDIPKMRTNVSSVFIELKFIYIYSVCRDFLFGVCSVIFYSEIGLTL